jgi:hypothetical protein
MIATMTVHERLVDLGADELEAGSAEALLGRLMPVGRPVQLTDEVLRAACASDHMAVAEYFAEAVDADDDEIAALAEAAAMSDGTLVDLDDALHELHGPL